MYFLPWADLWSKYQLFSVSRTVSAGRSMAAVIKHDNMDARDLSNT